MSELRKDPVNNRWVITLDDKGFAPGKSFSMPEVIPEHDKSCPFCKGNESMSGTLIDQVSDSENNWKVRVVPNNNPYLKVETELKEKGEGVFDCMSGTGANEVIIESPLHNLDFDTMDHDSVVDVITTYKNRINDLINDTRLEYLLIFRNRGERSGATLLHPHSQIMGMPVIPKTVLDEIESSKSYFEKNSRCVFCDIVSNEIEIEKRVVCMNDDFLCIAPYASISPFELWIIPRHHNSHFHTITDEQISNFAGILQDSLSRLNMTLHKPSYNYMIHTNPVKHAQNEYYHWHMEIFPRVKHTVGFEWGSGIHINPTLPEEAAVYLRQIK